MNETKPVEMTPEQVVEWRAQVWPVLVRLCKLQEEVSHRLSPMTGFRHANDCFCGTGGFWPRADSFRNEMTTIDWIEQTVRARLDGLALAGLAVGGSHGHGDQESGGEG